MKKILLVLTMLAASVLLAQPAIATLDDPGQTTTDPGTSTEPTTDPDTSTDPTTDTPTEPTESTPAPNGSEFKPSSKSAAKDAAGDDAGSKVSASAVDLNAKVTICHVPPGNSENPHAITVSYSSIVKGEGHGKDNEAHASDWIPAFEYMDGDVVKQYPGRNTDKPNPCGEQVPLTEVTPLVPTAGDPTCTKDGTLNIPDGPEGVTYTTEPEFDGPGDYTVTASADKGFVLSDDVDPVTEVTVLPKLHGSDCAGVKDDNDDEGDGLLPDTGGLPLWGLLVAGPMVAAGFYLIRRRKPEDQSLI